MKFTTDIYFEKIEEILLNKTQITGIEIEGCIENPETLEIQRTWGNITPEFWSVYLRDSDGLAICIADCDSNRTAINSAMLFQFLVTEK